MHPLSVESRETRNIAFALAVSAIAITFIVRTVLRKYGVYPVTAVYVPSSFTIYGILFFTFAQALWKLRPLHWLGIVSAPDISGTWKGDLRSSHSGLSKPHPIKLTVHQTWTTILLTVDSDRSLSRSTMARFSIVSPNELDLRWEYQAETKDPGNVQFNHRGVTRLILQKSGSRVLSKATGDYYTQHGRDTNGTISLERQP